MGSSNSKPAAGPSHVWQSETPVRFSEGMVDSLQGSFESDSTRAKTLELHVQTRVAEELKRLQAREEATLASLLEADASQGSDNSATNESAAGDALRTLGREAVSRDVAKLREKLEKRRKVKEINEVDAAVETARENVIKCLRGNDRRPLDCWKEVEAFKEGVRRLEGTWVESVVR